LSKLSIFHKFAFDFTSDFTTFASFSHPNIDVEKQMRIFKPFSSLSKREREKWVQRWRGAAGFKGRERELGAKMEGRR